jgi:hypothetical protein
MGSPNWKIPTNNQIIAGKEIGTLLLQALTTDRGLHAETAIVAAARMAGTYLFRSFHFPAKGITPGQPVFSTKSDEEIPLLLRTVERTLLALKFPEPYFEGHKIPDGHEPALTISQTRKVLDEGIEGVMIKYKLTFEQIAHSCAIVSARLIRMTADKLNPAIGFSLCEKGFIEGAKTMPDPMREVAAKSWLKRLDGPGDLVIFDRRNQAQWRQFVRCQLAIRFTYVFVYALCAVISLLIPTGLVLTLPLLLLAIYETVKAAKWRRSSLKRFVANEPQEDIRIPPIIFP